jgi:hypothetical protein
MDGYPLVMPIPLERTDGETGLVTHFGGRSENSTAELAGLATLTLCLMRLPRLWFLTPRADRQRPDNGRRLRPRIKPANAWLPRSRTCPIGVGVNAMVEQPIIRRLNPQVP